MPEGLSLSVNQCVPIDDNAALHQPQLTVSGWFLFRTPPSLTAQQVLFSIKDTSAGILCEVSWNNNMISLIMSAGKTFPNLISFIPDRKFHHFAITYDGTDMVFYLDGSQRYPETGTTGTGVPLVYTTISLTIGAHVGSTGLESFFNGEVYDVRVYGSALDAHDVAELLCASGRPFFPFSPPATTPPPATGLIGWWPLDQVTGTQVSDGSGNNIAAANISNFNPDTTPPTAPSITFDLHQIGVGGTVFAVGTGASATFQVSGSFSPRFLYNRLTASALYNGTTTLPLLALTCTDDGKWTAQFSAAGAVYGDTTNPAEVTIAGLGESVTGDIYVRDPNGDFVGLRRIKHKGAPKAKKKPKKPRR